MQYSTLRRNTVGDLLGLILSPRGAGVRRGGLSRLVLAAWFFWGLLLALFSMAWPDLAGLSTLVAAIILVCNVSSEAGRRLGDIVESGQLEHLRYGGATDREIVTALGLAIWRSTLGATWAFATPVLIGLLLAQHFVLAVGAGFGAILAGPIPVLFWLGALGTTARVARGALLVNIVGIARAGGALGMITAAVASVLAAPILSVQLAPEQLTALGQRLVLGAPWLAGAMLLVGVLPALWLWLLDGDVFSRFPFAGCGSDSIRFGQSWASLLSRLATLGIAGRRAAVYRFVLEAHLRRDRRFALYGWAIWSLLAAILFGLPLLSPKEVGPVVVVRAGYDVTLFLVFFGYFTVSATKYSTETAALWIGPILGVHFDRAWRIQRGIIRVLLILPCVATYAIRAAMLPRFGWATAVDVALFWFQLEVVVLLAQSFGTDGLFCVQGDEDDRRRNMLGGVGAGAGGFILALAARGGPSSPGAWATVAGVHVLIFLIALVLYRRRRQRRTA